LGSNAQRHIDDHAGDDRRRAQTVLNHESHGDKLASNTRDR